MSWSSLTSVAFCHGLSRKAIEFDDDYCKMEHVQKYSDDEARLVQLLNIILIPQHRNIHRIKNGKHFHIIVYTRLQNRINKVFHQW